MGRSMKRLQRHAALAQQRQIVDMVTREDDITAITSTELYGGTTTPLFSVFTERPLMSFAMIGAYHPALDWIGWTPSLVNFEQKGFLTYAAADGAAAASPTSGVVSDPCSPGNTIEFGTCDYVLSGFGRLRRQTPARSDDNDGLIYSDLIDAHRINGTVIRDEKEFDMFLCTSVVIQDLHRQLIIGNKGTAGEFDGLEQLIISGYLDSGAAACSAMDSTVINWNGLDMAQAVSDTNGTQITINGTAVNDGTYNLYGMLEWVMRNHKIRLKFAPLLNNRVAAGDALMLMPTSYIKPFLNVVTCFVKCGGDFARMTTDAALSFYNDLWLEDDPIADAQFELEGTMVMISGYDYELDNGDGTADMYLLIRGSNGIPFLYGEYKDHAPTVRNKPSRYATTDGNMLLTWAYQDQTCARRVVQMQPRLHMPAPFVQTRISNVPYEGVLSQLSEDPLSANYISNLIKAGFS